MPSPRIFYFTLLTLSFFLFTGCDNGSKYATEQQVKLYDSLQTYMKQHKPYFMADAQSWKGEKAVEIMSDIMEKDIDAVLERQHLTKPEDVSALLMNMSLWVDIHKEKYGNAK